ncbi:hypothetical protein Tco_1239909 [Tanacetum coccineum]
MTRIDSLEKDLKQTKQTLRNAIVKLVKKVKKMKKVVRAQTRGILTDSEDEGAKKSSTGVLSQIKTKRRNVKTGVRRRLDAEDVSTGFQDISTGFEEVSTGFTDIKSASEKISSGGEHVSASQREGKVVLEETPQTKRTKKQIREEQASLAKIARIQAKEEAENAMREELKRQDELAAKRLQEELESNVQDLVIESAGGRVSEADYAQRMDGFDKSCRRKTYCSAKRAKAQEEKPMTQALRKRVGKELVKSSNRIFQEANVTDTREDVFKPESTKSGTKEDVEAYMEERVDEPSSEEFPMGSIPQGPTLAKIVKWQIIKTGKRGAYQIIREDNTDVGDLKTMFDPPSTEDAVWNLTHQQTVLSWRYFHSCAVHCLTLEAAHIYMLTEVKYPLPPRVCKAMLEKKLLGDRKDEISCCKDQVVMISRVADRSQEPVYTGRSSCCSSRIIPKIMLTKSSGRSKMKLSLVVLVSSAKYYVKSGSTKVSKLSLANSDNSYLRDILGDILGKDMNYPFTCL